MSVLPCSRRGCGNVMCDLYSPTHGYICNSCFEELVASGPGTDIEAFLDGEPGEGIDLEASRQYFRSIFEDRWEDYNDGE